MSKFLNISTDTTLGGNSPSDTTVSSQKALKTYIDSQTGTAPAFANITGQPTDNTNLASALNAKYDASNPNGYTSNVGTVTSVNNVSPVNGNVTLSIPTVDSALSTSSTNPVQNKVITSALNGKLDGYTVAVAGQWTGGVHAVNFMTVDYTDADSNNGVFIKLSMVNAHGNGINGKFYQDAIISVNYVGTTEVTIYRYFAVAVDDSSSIYYGTHKYGDIFWTIDTTNKIVKFFVLMRQYSYTYETPYMRLNTSTKGVITQKSGAYNDEYSSGTQYWGTINDLEHIPTVTDTYSATSSDGMSGKAVASALSSYVPTSRTINSKALSSNITLSASDVGAVATNTTITGSTKCKITYDSKGLVTGGADLSASDIPDLSSTYQTKLSSSNKLSTDYISGLATVATSGKSSDLNNDAGFITGITSGDVTTALGYTPYNSTNPSGYITGITSSDVTTALGYTPYNSSNPSGYQANVIETVKVNGTALTPSSKAVDVTVPTETTVSGWGFTKNAGTVTSVNNVSPVSGNVTLSIPTVNDATLTITQGGVSKGTFTANASSDVTIDLDAGGGSAVRNIGEIVQSTIPLTDAGLHLLDGSVINGAGSYSAFVTYIAGLVSGHSELFTTEANWQTSVTNYGVCGKFVYDSQNNTVRLPKLYSNERYLIKSYSSGTDWYRIYSDGWCEQGGHFGTLSQSLQTVYFLKEFTNTNYNIQVSFATTVAPYTSSASVNYYEASNKTASSFTISGHGNANIADKDWVAFGYIDISDLEIATQYNYIVIATSTKTQIEVDIDEVMTDLNGKADVDLSNCTKPYVTETYVNGADWYRIWSDGWCEQGGVETSTSTTFLVPFVDTNYFIAALAVTTASTTQTNRATNVTGKTTTGFTTYATQNRNWYACGYIR